mmetsp:Transcript_27902/g.78035  ORF Transcript_27902/g.78035 Transcript_27902/m.78035 type:complete len:512 (-) Transcript_27902:62-1597(-)
MRGVGLLVAVCLVACVTADVYLHMPRGSNNRLNEQTANRNNGNRLFDSQNNNKGGYNVGDSGAAASQNMDQQYNERYLEGSDMTFTWTNQHGCGGPEDPNDKTRCELVVEMMCSNELRNGQNTNTPNEQGGDANAGLHESAAWYADCKARERNKGLFTADQNLNGDTAIYTRQNPNGARSGLECPEERDYFPYWVETPFVPIAVMTSNTSRCASIYDPYFESRGMQPNCISAPWSRDNHNGNGRSGWQNMLNFTMPRSQSLCGQGTCRCISRLRYNISTTDYPWDLDASLNGEELSPVQQNPTVNFGTQQGFKLAINTAQTGRTFQDRSHIFNVVPRPNGVNGRVVNVQVQGKRGNIVQTYPATEYDFVPQITHLKRGDWVHIQWTGSNTHNNNAPAGDGQAGDDGEGTGGTDRNNMVQIVDEKRNYPTQFAQTTMWTGVTDSVPQRSATELALAFATAGNGVDTDPLLNNAPASFDGGLLRFEPGTYRYMCTRNNNFSNRGQKGVFVVHD